MRISTIATLYTIAAVGMLCAATANAESSSAPEWNEMDGCCRANNKQVTKLSVASFTNVDRQEATKKCANDCKANNACTAYEVSRPRKKKTMMYTCELHDADIDSVSRSTKTCKKSVCVQRLGPAAPTQPPTTAPSAAPTAAPSAPGAAVPTAFSLFQPKMKGCCREGKDAAHGSANIVIIPGGTSDRAQALQTCEAACAGDDTCTAYELHRAKGAKQKNTQIRGYKCELHTSTINKATKKSRSCKKATCVVKTPTTSTSTSTTTTTSTSTTTTTSTSTSTTTAPCSWTSNEFAVRHSGTPAFSQTPCEPGCAEGGGVGSEEWVDLATWDITQGIRSLEKSTQGRMAKHHGEFKIYMAGPDPSPEGRANLLKYMTAQSNEGVQHPAEDFQGVGPSPSPGSRYFMKDAPGYTTADKSSNHVTSCKRGNKNDKFPSNSPYGGDLEGVGPEIIFCCALKPGFSMTAGVSINGSPSMTAYVEDNTHAQRLKIPGYYTKLAQADGGVPVKSFAPPLATLTAEGAYPGTKVINCQDARMNSHPNSAQGPNFDTYSNDGDTNVQVYYTVDTPYQYYNQPGLPVTPKDIYHPKLVKPGITFYGFHNCSMVQPNSDNKCEAVYEALNCSRGTFGCDYTEGDRAKGQGMKWTDGGGGPAGPKDWGYPGPFVCAAFTGADVYQHNATPYRPYKEKAKHQWHYGEYNGVPTHGLLGRTPSGAQLNEECYSDADYRFPVNCEEDGAFLGMWSN